MSAFQADICIRGAGITGRVLALLLAREKLRVALTAPPERASKAPDVRSPRNCFSENVAGDGELHSGLRENKTICLPTLPVIFPSLTL